MRPAPFAAQRFIPALILLAAIAPAACEPGGGREGCRGEYCGTLVFVTAGEPDVLLPPVAQTALARDVHDQLFLKLADVGMSLNTIGDRDFEPQLAQRWEWDDSLTLVFHLDPRARWHDGPAVTAADVAFTFAAYTDPRVTSSAALRYIASVTARDSATAVFRFRRRYPEMFFDAVFQMRVLPRHHLADVPRDQWNTAPFGKAPVGSGPYRLVEWREGQSLELAADSTFFLGRPHIRRLIWRFTPDVPTAVTQLVGGEADAFEFLGPPPLVERARQAPHLVTYPYLGTTYGYLGFNLRAPGDTTRPHPVFADPDVRRAIAMALDRERNVRSVFGDLADVPNGPVTPSMTLIWEHQPPAAAYDTAQAARLLSARGWRDSDGDGIRDRNGQALAFRILTNPSPLRMQFAQLIQEQLRQLGVRVEIDQVEQNLHGERARAGQFDAVMQAWLTDPSPAASIPQTWTRAGFGAQNYGRYHSAAFEQAVERASHGAGSVEEVRAAWRAALAILNADVPGVWLYAPHNTAAVHRRVANVRVRADSWWALAWTWSIPPDQQIDRDRVVR